MKRLALLVFCFAAVTGEVLFTVEPDTILPGINRRVNLNCSVTANSTDVNSVLIIQLEKVNGNDVTPFASVSPGDRPRVYGTHIAGRVDSLTGAVSMHDPAESFLALSIKDPGTADAGLYVCAMSVLDSANLLQKIESTTNVTVTDATDSEATTAVIEELRALQEQVSRLSSQVHSHGGGHCVCGTTASTQAGSASSGQPTTAPATLVAFTARPKEARTFERQRLQFDEVEVNVGGAYDPARSQFVAPVNGTYMLTASVSCSDGKTISEIRVNDQTKGQLATLGDDQTTLSMALNLMAGDHVWVDCIFANQNDTHIFADDDTLFSGFLIRQL